MGFLPFRRQIEELFASDRSAFLKILAGAIIGGYAAVRVSLKEGAKRTDYSLAADGFLIVTLTLVGAVGVLLLLLRDVVVKQVDRGEQVNPLLKAYFGRGNPSAMLALWFFTAVVTTLSATILILGP